MYPSDFGADQPAPLLEPTLFAALLALAGAIAVVAWFLGREEGRKAGGADAARACERIHEQILKAARAAMTANRDDVQAKARKLHDKVSKLLGPVLTVGGRLDSLTGALEKALDPDADSHGHDDHGHGHGHGHDHGDHGHGPKDAVPASVAIYNPDTVIVSQPEPKDDKGHGKHDDHTKPSRPTRTALLRKAVADFTDWWERPERIDELKAARRALTTAPRD